MKNETNFMRKNDAAKIWMPAINFHMSDTTFPPVFTDHSIVIITPKQEPTLNSVFETTKAYVYKGADNPITLMNSFDLTFFCDYDLTMYPFDIQRCQIEVRQSGIVIFDVIFVSHTNAVVSLVVGRFFSVVLFTDAVL